MKEMFIKIQIKFPFCCKQFEIITRQNRWKIIQIYMDIYIEENTQSECMSMRLCQKG